MKTESKKPDIINPQLLWEYDLETFNYLKSYKIVIERVLERGNLEQWNEMTMIYTRSQILDTIKWSAQLDKRDKDFSKLFLNSDFLNAA
ncbi:MAG: hypothetical protein J0H55_06220 [Chitinophagaceae bacterium]|nr:hypothetical protein [Chitinophagaceae bacterium]